LLVLGVSDVDAGYVLAIRYPGGVNGYIVALSLHLAAIGIPFIVQRVLGIEVLGGDRGFHRFAGEQICGRGRAACRYRQLFAYTTKEDQSGRYARAIYGSGATQPEFLLAADVLCLNQPEAKMS